MNVGTYILYDCANERILYQRENRSRSTQCPARTEPNESFLPLQSGRRSQIASSSKLTATLLVLPCFTWHHKDLLTPKCFRGSLHQTLTVSYPSRCSPHASSGLLSRRRLEASLLSQEREHRLHCGRHPKHRSVGASRDQLQYGSQRSNERKLADMRDKPSIISAFRPHEVYSRDGRHGRHSTMKSEGSACCVEDTMSTTLKLCRYGVHFIYKRNNTIGRS